MRSITDNDQKQLALVAELFTEAENAIKDIEDIGSELVVPAVNQLRYCGNHLVRYLNNTDNREELLDAVKHCKRATYDAYEAATTYHLLEFNKFKDDYRKVQVFRIIPDYADIKHRIVQARKFIRSNNESKTRGDFYRDGREHLNTLAENVEKLNANRDDLNILIVKERRTLLLQLLGGVGALAAICTLSFSLINNCDDPAVTSKSTNPSAVSQSVIK